MWAEIRLCAAKKSLLLSTNKGTLILNLNTVQYMDMKKTTQYTYSLVQKNPNKPTPSNLKKKKICLLKKIVTTTRVHYLSPTSSHDTFYYNHIKSHWLKVGLGVSHHLTCNPSWYWTAACIASPSLSTRSFHVLFNASQAEFSCK